MSRIEQIITEIEDYIDSCKFQPLSNTKILVNKEEIEELLVELRLRIPEEIKKYTETKGLRYRNFTIELTISVLTISIR